MSQLPVSKTSTEPLLQDAGLYRSPPLIGILLLRKVGQPLRSRYVTRYSVLQCELAGEVILKT